MSLWMRDIVGWQEAALGRAALGSDVYLCAPGPSLMPVPAGPGVMVAALTKAYPCVRPDIWFGMDMPECYDRRIWWEGFLKVANPNYESARCDGRLIRDCPQTFFVRTKECLIAEMFSRPRGPAKFAWFRDTLSLALDVLMWMGAKDFKFVGFDLSTRAADYHSSAGLALPPDLKQKNQRLYDEQAGFLEAFAMLGRAHGIALTSCTPDSPLNRFMPYAPLENALAASRAKVPSAGRMMHCVQAHQAAADEIISAGRRPLPLTPAGIRAAFVRAKELKRPG